MKSFESLEGFIEHVKTNKEVVGIVEYGGRTYKDMSLGGDYDLTIVLKEALSEDFNGVHFHVGDIPVDCMLLSVKDFENDDPPDPFYLVHLDCKILYDPDGLTAELINRIRDKWAPDPLLSSFEKHLYRFSFQHILDKLEHRLYEDELFSRFFIHSSFDWYLACYARIHNLALGQPRAHLNHMKDHHKDLYRIASKLYNTLALTEQFSLLKEAAALIMQPAGGLWKKGEMLLHLKPGGKVISSEEEKVMDLLYGTTK